MKYLLFLLLPFALISCGDDKEVKTTPAGETVVEIDDEVVTVDPTVMQSTSLNETLDAIRNSGGITAIPVAAARKNIEGWIARLKLAEEKDHTDQYDEIIDDLEDLHEELHLNGNIDGHEVGEIMLELGEEMKARFSDNIAATQLADILLSEGAKLDAH